MRYLIQSIPIAALFCASCTTSLGLTSDIRTDSKRDAVAGVSYSLPMLQYDLTITRTLAQCEGKAIVYDAKGKPKIKADGSIQLKDVDEIAFSVSATAKEAYVPGETYLVDHTSLGAPTKISSVAMEFHENGTLKSVNLAAEDKTQEVVKNTVSTLVGVASIAAGLPIGAAPLGSDHVLICSSKTKKALSDLKAAEVVVENATTKLKSKTKELTDEVASFANIGGISALSDAQKLKLKTLSDEQRALMVQLALANEDLAKKRKPLSQTVRFRWPSAFDTLNSTGDARFELSASQKKIWRSLFELEAPVNIKSGGKQLCSIPPAADVADVPRTENDMEACLASKLSVSAILRPTILRAVKDEYKITVADNPSEKMGGMLVRPPEAGYLRLCKEIVAANCTLSTAADYIVLEPEAPSIVPQLGQLRFLAFQNGPFENHVMSFSLAESGALEKFEYKELASQAVGFTATASDTVSQIGGFLSDVRKYEDEQEAKAKEAAKAETEAAREAIITQREDEIAALQYQIDLLTKQKEFAQLTGPADTTSLDALNSETAEVNARVALLRARLAELQAESELESAS